LTDSDQNGLNSQLASVFAKIGDLILKQEVFELEVIKNINNTHEEEHKPHKTASGDVDFF